MNRILMLLLGLAACDVGDERSPCDVRADAVCAAYAECDPTFDVDACITGQTGFCEAGPFVTDMERALQCASDVELAVCGRVGWTPTCELRQ